MKISTIIRYSCFAALGVVASLMGFGVLSWQFWTLMVLMSIATTAAQEEKSP